MKMKDRSEPFTPYLRERARKMEALEVRKL